MASIHRSDYDITNTVRVSSPQAVLRAVEQLLVSTWPHIVLAPVERAFADFDALFAGQVDQVDLPGAEGDFGVLAGHAPVVAMLCPGL